MRRLEKNFESREALADYVASQAPWLDAMEPSPFEGTEAAGLERLEAVQPGAYGRTRNFLSGAVTKLSPYIRHGIVSLNQVRNYALDTVTAPSQAEKLIQELAWRDYWQRIYREHPEWIWQDVEDYKTGWSANDYAAELPEDIGRGQTGQACIDAFARELMETGYLHNHARMYLAAYVVHWRRVRWQAGAAWFLQYLLDGDPASNNLSWQWVASTFSRRPYIFNLDNVRKYCGELLDCSARANSELNASYEELQLRLFPHLGGDYA